MNALLFAGFVASNVEWLFVKVMLVILHAALFNDPDHKYFESQWN